MRLSRPIVTWRERLRQRLRRFTSDDHGQAIPLVVLVMMTLLGMAAIGIDYGRAAFASRILQSATDAAALAGAQALPTATSVAAITGAAGVVVKYSATSGQYNANANLPSVSVSSSVKCLSTLESEGIGCASAVPDNAVQVIQKSTYPMYFFGLFGHPTITLTAESTAAIRGGSARPSNIAIILDTTLSMNQYDEDCGYTQMQCSLNGVQILLQNLSPCASYMTSCGATSGVATNSFDRVALFTFPDVTVGTASIDTSCTTPISNTLAGVINNPTYGLITMLPGLPWSGLPTDVAYSFPSTSATSYAPTGSSTATYQLTPYYSDYRTSDSATSLNSTSALVKAVGGVTNCGSMGPANYDGEYGTYYAGVIYAAQASLLAEQALYPGSENVIILLSDGNATAPQTNNGYTVMPSPATGNGLYPSWVNECGQAVTAAQAATSAGTLVYTVAYGSEPTGCASDTNMAEPYSQSPCDTMEEMASAPQMFYSDWEQTGSGSTCYASQPVVALKDIFSSIAGDLTMPRLIPNNTT